MVVKNSILNVISMVVPGLFFIPAMAFLSRSLGVESFSLLLLVYAMLGYSSIFDAGMSRAVIRKIAQTNNQHDEYNIMGTSIGAVLMLCSIPILLFVIFSEDIVNWLSVSEANKVESEHAVQQVAWIIPFYLVSSVAFAYLEGKEQFLKLSLYKIITGVAIAATPALMVYFYGGLINAIQGLIFARIFVAIVALFALSKEITLVRLRFNVRVFLDLITFGGWISVSNVISPVMVYMDRFILSNTTGAASVAFYSAPAELIEKIAVIPGALARAIFPMFSRLGAHVDYAKKIYIGLSATLLVVLIPLFALSVNILDLWLGEPYGANSSGILKILILGFFFNALAQVPFAAIQAKGLSKITALVHLAEVLPYLILLFYLVNQFGLIGAAYAWSARVIIDFIILYYISIKI